MIDEHGRVHAMGEAAQLVDRLLGVGAQLAQRPPELIVRHRLGLRVGQPHPQRDQPLLGPVVEVALDLSPPGVRGRRQPRARGPQVGDGRSQIRLQARVLEHHQGRAARRADQPGLGVERSVVDDHRQGIAVLPDDGRGSAGGPRGRLHRMAARVDVLAALRTPERNRQRRIAQRVGEDTAGVEVERRRR